MMGVDSEPTAWARPHWWRFGMVLCGALFVFLLPAGAVSLSVGALLDRDAVGRALGGVLVTLSVLGVGGFLSASISGKDTQLYGVSPLTLRLYYRRHVERAWPLLAAGLVGAPVCAVVAWHFRPIPENFHWNAALILNAVTAYFAIVLMSVALIMQSADRGAPQWFSRKFQTAINVLTYGLVYFGLPSVLIFWDEFSSAASFAGKALLNAGSLGFLTLGLLSPGSALAVSGFDVHWQRELWVLTTMWSIAIAIALRVIVGLMRAQRPPRQFELSAIRGPAISDASPPPIPLRSQRIVSLDAIEAASPLPYSASLAPEHQFTRHTRIWTKNPASADVQPSAIFRRRSVGGTLSAAQDMGAV